MVYDAKAAIHFLRANAEKYRLDAERFSGWGPSSGGWLMSMAGVTKENPAFEDLSMGNGQVSSALQAVVDWCGPCGDFLNMDTAFLASHAGAADHNAADSPESRFLGARTTHISELSRMACPCTYASADTPPFMIVHGGVDQVMPVSQSGSIVSFMKRHPMPRIGSTLRRTSCVTGILGIMNLGSSTWV